MAAVIVKDISPDEYLEHLLALDLDSIVCRFGSPLNSYAISKYVKNIPQNDYLLGAFDSVYGELLGAAHVALSSDDNQAEVGISTSINHRRKHVAQTIMLHIMAMCRNRNISQLYMTCLSSNNAIISLCKKVGLAVVSRSGESETILELPAPAIDSIVREMHMTNMVIADILMKPYYSTWAGWLRKHKNEKLKSE